MLQTQCQRALGLGSQSNETAFDRKWALMGRLSGLDTQRVTQIQYGSVSTAFCPKHDIQSHQRHPSLFCLGVPFKSSLRPLCQGTWASDLSRRLSYKEKLTEAPRQPNHPYGAISLRGPAGVDISKHPIWTCGEAEDLSQLNSKSLLSQWSVLVVGNNSVPLSPRPLNANV